MVLCCPCLVLRRSDSTVLPVPDRRWRKFALNRRLIRPSLNKTSLSRLSLSLTFDDTTSPSSGDVGDIVCGCGVNSCGTHWHRATNERVTWRAWVTGETDTNPTESINGKFCTNVKHTLNACDKHVYMHYATYDDVSTFFYTCTDHDLVIRNHYNNCYYSSDNNHNLTRNKNEPNVLNAFFSSSASIITRFATLTPFDQSR